MALDDPVLQGAQLGQILAGPAELIAEQLADRSGRRRQLHFGFVGQIHAAQAQSAEQFNHFRSSYATRIKFDYPLDAKAPREPRHH